MANRDFDLVVTDEAHHLSSNAQGNATDALRKFRALTGHPDGFETKAMSVFAKEFQAVQNAPDGEKRKLYAAYRAKADPAIAQWKQRPRGKALMLSATPFAHHFSLDYAEGYLFDFPKDNNGGGYNRAEGRDKFYVENLGYRMRYNRLTKPDAEVRTDILERDLHEKMKKSGAIIGRTLEVEHDYDRKFVLTENELGRQIDDVFKWLSSTGDGRYYPLYDRYQKNFDYLSRARLLEAMKARSVIPLINKNVEMGRKVMVFHNFNTGGGFNPFNDLSESKDVASMSVNGKSENVKIADLYNEFLAANPHVRTLKFASYLSPIEALKNEFGNKVAIYNGTVSKKARDEALAKWNEKGSGVDVIVIQSDAGQAGLSGHDTAGDAPRILYNLGLPTKPTAAIQQEGRIYRDGQKSDAMFRYLNTGTTWERMAFASTIASRAGTAENLAMGNQARTLKQSFIDSYLDSAEWEPGHAGEGTGGKEADRAMTQQMTPFQRAKTYYYSQQKRDSRTKSQEGVDYFATPEPIGVKMVEWADIKPGENVLEPSVGHGAIARWFPEGVNATIIDPSQELLSKAMLNTGGGARAVHGRFENFNIVNKFHAIVMNPPFGVGGKTAIEHLDKAVTHLKNGGRIVALLPTGPAADKRFDDWYEKTKGIYLVRDTKMPAITFKRAGTGVMTRIIVLEKQTDKGVEPPLASNRDYSNVQTIEELFDRIEDSEVPARAVPITVENDIPAEGIHMVNGLKFELFPMKAENPDGDQIVKPASFLGRETFAHLKAIAAKHEGTYEGASGRVSGFRFVSIEDRNAFLNAYQAKPNPDPVAETAEEAAQPTAFDTATAFNRVRGKNQYVATLKGKVGRERYMAILAVAKEKGGYYSSFKGSGAVPGFQFNSQEDRQKFLDHFENEKDGKKDARNVIKKTIVETESKYFNPTSNFEATRDSDLGLAAREYVLNAVKNLPEKMEAMVVFDGDGNVVSEGHGKVRQQLGFSPTFEKMVEDPGLDLIVHHNHPTGRSLSYQDLLTFTFPGIRVIYAHSKDHYFRASLNKEFSRILDSFSPSMRHSIMNRVVKKTHDKFWSLMQKKVTNREFSTKDVPVLSLETAHMVNTLLDHGGMINYKTDFESKMISDDRIQEIIQDGVQAVKRYIASLKKEQGNAENDRSDRPANSTRFIGDMAGIFERSGSYAGRPDGAKKSALGTGAENGLFEDENRLTAPVFYSEVLRATNSISQNKAQPAQWLAMIRKTPGVKQEEIEWLGLEEWLGSQTGAVTKDQIQDFIRANQITVQEVEKGVSEADIEALLNDESGADMSREEAFWYLSSEEGGPKYGAYTLPGGENYRELLLTLPPDTGPFGAAAAEAYTRLSNELHKKYGNGIRLKATPEELAKLDDLNDRAIGKGGNYQSSHWDEPNVLAHVRFSERMQEIPLTEDEKAANIKRAEMVAEYNRLNDKLDKARHAVAAERQPIMERIRREVFEDAKAGKFPAGRMNEEENKRLDGALSDDTSAVRAFRAAEKQAADFWRSMPQEIKNRAVRALHIEEIQSDWHQAGRKEGYAGRKIDTSKWSASKFGVSAWAVSDHTGRVINALEFGETAEEAIANTALTKSEMAVPDAPFKTTWPELAFKRMLRYAVDNGFDRIVWTPGDVQADRFDLSKQVDSIGYRKNDDGTYYVSVQAHGEGRVLNDGKLTEGQLAEVVGKEVADKIVDGEGKTENWAGNNEPRNEFTVLSGLDLKIGGEGMRGFYDNILPKTVQKMVKKWGGKVETSKILEDKKPTSPLEQVPFDPDNVPGGQQVWSLDITEDMRTAAMEGLALFEDDAAFSEPSTQNWTVPKRGTFEVLFKGNGRLLKRLQHAKSAEAVGASIDNWRVKFQDRFLPMLRVEQAIEEHRGEALPEEMKVYAAEELYTGRTGSRLDRIQRRYMEPIASIMRENSITQEEIGEYLYARHAKERNARIAEINPKMPDGGSGMKNADASAKMAEFEARDKNGAFKMIGKMVDRMLRESVRFRVEAGLLSQQAADAWQKYQHYVPLRGWEEVDESSEPGMPNTGKGFTAQGKESRMALGRSSRAGDILATAYSVAHEAVIRGEKNRVVQRLYDLAKANPNKQYWEINPVRMIRVFNRATGMVTERPESPIFAKDANKTVSAKFKGVEHRIVIHDPELAEAIKRLNAEDLNGMLKFLIGVNRYLSTMNTSLNPEFLVSNALRDVQTASVVMATKGEKGLTKAVLKDYRKALAGSWGGLRGKSLSTEWRRWFNEYDRAGGKIAFYKMETIGDLRNEVEKSARQLSAKDYRTVWRGMKAVGQFIEDANLAVDNALRLALYKNLRERGYTQDQAASAAKNLTVNFNRRGQYGVTVNALYLFANAGIQGSAVVINSLKHRRARQMVGAMTAGSFALTIANIMLLGLDDDNGESEYSKLLAEKEWELQRNLVVMLPGRREDGGQNYAKFPLPYGYNLFHAIGRKMAEVAMGLEDTAGALKDTAVTFIDAFNPIGGTDSIAKLISPTVIDPFIEMSENADFAGRKIRPERDKYDRYMPKSQDYYGSVSPISRHLAAMLNEWTGGNEFKPGAVDVSPEWIDHYAKFLGGAASATLWRPVNTATKLVRGEEVTTNDVPFLRRVHGATGSYIDRSLFYSRVDEIQSAHAQTDGFRKKGDRESFEALDKRTKLLGSMYSKGFRDMMNRMKEIRLARNEIYAAPLAAAERSARLKKLDEAENRVVQAFNRAYLRTVAKSRE